MATVLDELLVALGYDYDDEGLSQFKKDVEQVTNVVKKLAAVAVAGATALTGLAVASTAASDEQGKQAKEAGILVEELDALEFASRRVGDANDSVGQSLRELSKRVSEASRGVGSGVEAFGLLGISVLDSNGQLKSTNNILFEVAGALQGLDNARQIELADKLGLSGSIRLLQAGPREIRNLVNEAKAFGVTTEEDAVLAAEFQDSLVDLWAITKQLARTITRSLVPIMETSVNLFTEWWKTNRGLIEQNMPRYIEMAATAVKLLGVAVAALLALRLLRTISALVTKFRALSVAILLANAAALLLPTLIGAAALAFVGLLEDAKVFMRGGESVLGDLLKEFPEWEKQIRSVAIVLEGIADTILLIAEGWANIITAFKEFSIDDYLDVIKNIPAFLSDRFGVLIDKGVEAAKTNNLTTDTGILDTIGGSISNTKNTIVEKVDIVIEGAGQSASEIAREVFNLFQQTDNELNSAVDQ